MKCLSGILYCLNYGLAQLKSLRMIIINICNSLLLYCFTLLRFIYIAILQPTPPICPGLSTNFLCRWHSWFSYKSYSLSYWNKSKAFKTSIIIVPILASSSRESAMPWQNVTLWLSNEYLGLNIFWSLYNLSILFQTCLSYSANILSLSKFSPY